jgi:hypothetical protein
VERDHRADRCASSGRVPAFRSEHRLSALTLLVAA